MSFLTLAEKNNTANTLSQWNTQALSGMEQAKTAFLSISAQLEAMKTNPDYTQDDILEVTRMLGNLVSVAKSLIPTE
jgi:hypothetical protein